MRRLSTRLIVSHLAVAVLAGLATFLTVRMLAPRLFVEEIVRPRPGRGGGPRPSDQLREQFGTAVDNALLIGTGVGIAAAAAVGVVAAIGILTSLKQVRSATKTIASGRYDVRVPTLPDEELQGLGEDVNALASSLAETEQRRVRLLGEVAHEMRTPLTVVDGTLEAMIDGVIPMDAEQLNSLQGEVRRMRRLSDDLSLLSKSEEGRLGIETAEMDLRIVVNAAAERLRPQAEDAGISLHCAEGAPVVVRGDALRIAQVVTNLVGNAIAATPDGGAVRVAVEKTPSPRIFVSDTGAGLAAQDAERIFDRFYRVPGRIPGEGSGIGLTIARQIMRGHGGDLTVHSDGEGRGASFTATLPHEAPSAVLGL